MADIGTPLWRHKVIPLDQPVIPTPERTPAIPGSVPSKTEPLETPELEPAK